MKMRKSLLATVLIACLAFGATACTKPAEDPKNATGTTKEPFRVGLECAYAPFNWTQTDHANGGVPIEGGGFAAGYDVEIAKKVAAALDRDLVIVKTEWDGLLPSLTSGKIDAIIAGMSPTAERKESIDFSDVYYISDMVVVVKKDGPFVNAKTVNDFSSAKVTGQLNTSHYTAAGQLVGADLQPAMSDFPSMIAALSSGKIDAYVTERPGAMAATQSNPNLIFVAIEGFEYDETEVSAAIGLKKGSALTAPINEALKTIPEADRQKLMEDAIKVQSAAQ